MNTQFPENFDPRTQEGNSWDLLPVGEYVAQIVEASVLAAEIRRRLLHCPHVEDHRRRIRGPPGLATDHFPALQRTGTDHRPQDAEGSVRRA